MDTANRRFEQSLPVDFSEYELFEFLRYCVAQKTSDITIQSDDQVWGEVARTILPFTDRRLEPNEVERVLRFIYGPTGVAMLLDGMPNDFEFEMPAVDGKYDEVMRFRGNATASRIGSVSAGISITMRTIPGLPPKYASLNVPQDITDNIFLKYGLALIIGTTGSGKSTLLGAMNRERLENGTRPVKIITYEDPIEFVYTGLAKGRMPQPSQVQIGRNLKNYNDAGRNAMRRKADIIIMGESRDLASVSACFEMALSGHGVYSTLHVDTPAEVFARMVSFYPEDAQPAAANKLLDTLKIVVAQKLALRTDNKVSAIRSWLVIDREVKQRLGDRPFFEWGRIAREIMTERGTSFELQTLPLVLDGSLEFTVFKEITNMTIREARAFLKANSQLDDVSIEHYIKEGTFPRGMHTLNSEVAA